HLSCLVHGQALGLEEFIFQGLQGLVVQLELHLERAVRHPTAPAEEVHHLVEYLVEVHHHPSTCASAASAWGSQKVMSMARYRAIAADRAARAGARRPVWPYSQPSPWWQRAMSGRIPSSSARARACW